MHLGLRDNWLRSEAGQSLRASRWGRNGRCPVKNGVGFRAGINGCLHYFATEKKKMLKMKAVFFFKHSQPVMPSPSLYLSAHFKE